MMVFQPIQLKRIGEDRLQIVWSDGQVREYLLRELRDGCPCATCAEKGMESPDPPSSSLPILSTAKTEPLRIARMEAVGNYAYAIGFSDGHDTGIYTLELLRELGRVVE